VTLDLANRHAARVKAQNLVIEAIKSGSDLWRSAAARSCRRGRGGPQSRSRHLAQNRLRAGAVAAVATAAASRVASLIAKMLCQLGSQRALDQRLLQPLEKPLIAGQVFRLLIVSKQLIEQLRK